MTICSMKAYSDMPNRNCHPTLQFSYLRSVLASFSSSFCFHSPTLLWFTHSSLISRRSKQLILMMKLRLTHCTLPTQQQTSKLAAKEQDISPRSWWRPKERYKEREYCVYFHPEARNTTPNSGDMSMLCLCCTRWAQRN